jgi:hypothetical protein
MPSSLTHSKPIGYPSELIKCYFEGEMTFGRDNWMFKWKIQRYLDEWVVGFPVENWAKMIISY